MGKVQLIVPHCGFFQ